MTSADSSSSSDDEQDRKEGLQILLGDGSLLAGLSMSAWDQQSEDDEDNGIQASDTSRMAVSKAAPPPNTRATYGDDTVQNETRPSHSFVALEPESTKPIMAWAYTTLSCNSSTTCVTSARLPVQVVDMSESGRGHALVATRSIRRGEVLFTEQAAVACQVPIMQEFRASFGVRACQCCFQSLELITTLLQSKKDSITTRQSQDRALLPLPHLWPIPSSEILVHGVLDEVDQSSSSILRDEYGRCVCQSCKSWFCSPYCQKRFNDELGPCCQLSQVMLALPRLLSSADSGDGSESDVVQSAVALAVRMFVKSIHQHRNEDAPTTTGFEGLCGDSSNVSALELGVATRDENGNTTYSLERVHRRIMEVYQIDDDMIANSSKLSLNEFHMLAAMAARNGVDLVTISPFQTYYSSLLRNYRGGCRRGSESHELLKQTVAHALGYDQLERGMDRELDSLVTPQVVGLFPLTARINHACRPNASIRQASFIDARIDMVAEHDISTGEEITISYIATGPTTGRKRGARRRRELKAKYLFECDCELCKLG